MNGLAMVTGVEMRCGLNSINSLSLRLNIHPASSADWHTEVTILEENSESIGDKLITSDPIPLLELTLILGVALPSLTSVLLPTSEDLENALLILDSTQY